MSQAAGKIIIEEIKNNPVSLLTFAAGNTPIGILKFLVQFCRKERNFFKNSFFVSLDEWVGMNGSNVGSCRNTLDSFFFHPMGIDNSQILFFNGKPKNLPRECMRVNRYLEKMGPLDLVLLGVGLNGHIGFNEPGTLEGSECRSVDLQESTQKKGANYFDQNKDLSQGLTLGIKQLMEAKLIILVANGIQKAGILKDLLTKEIGSEIPASFLRRHPNCKVIADKEACSKIEIGAKSFPF